MQTSTQKYNRPARLTFKTSKKKKNNQKKLHVKEIIWAEKQMIIFESNLHLRKKSSLSESIKR